MELYEYLKFVGIYAGRTVWSNHKGLKSLAADKALKRGDFDSHGSDQDITYFKCLFFAQFVKFRDIKKMVQIWI